MSSKEAPKKPRRVCIVNDGRPGYATRITDADTGESIDGIFHVRLVDLDVKDMPKVILWAYVPAIDVTVDAEIVDCCPHCGAQKPDLKLDDNRIKTTINDTDLDLSIDKLKQLQDLQRSTRGNNIYPAEALTAFVEWLQHKYGDHSYSLDELSYRVDSFCEAQGWKLDQEYYNEVIGKVKANYPE